MKYYCSCGFKGGLELAEVFEGVEAYMIHCPSCSRLLVEHFYNDLDEALEELDEAQRATLRDILPSEDQARYLIHLCNKQMDKLNNAKKQLSELTEKTRVMLEMVQDCGD